MKEHITSTLEQLPRSSGVYKFYDTAGEILYIGKAHNLKSRVSSYFSSKHYDRPRIVSMIPLIENIEIITTENDIEALVLESALIKKYQPKYNSDAKDDKSYAYLYINHKAKYPTVKIVRNITSKESRDGKLFGPYPQGNSVKRVFRYLRRIYPFCTSKDPSKPCFYTHIGLCPGPVDPDIYRKNIDGIIKFLQGKNRTLVKDLEIQMSEYSKRMDYENAAILRDKIEDLKYISSKINSDILQDEGKYIENRKEFKLEIFKKLGLELGVENLNRIECYDISNTQGTLAYGSMTVALNGEIKPSQYRIFKIKGTTDLKDDAHMLSEVISRRIAHFDNGSDISLDTKPDLILIDGGPIQLQEILKIIPGSIKLVGITKGRKYKRKGYRLLDEFWVDTTDGIKSIKIKNQAILVQLRDEAHRFAISHHRKARVKNQVVSILDNIPNVGPKTKKILKTQFADINEIKSADVENLLGIIKNRKIATSIYEYFRKL